MNGDSTLAQGISAADDSARYDEACKRLLSEKSILARIMKACLTEYAGCDVDEIAEKYIEGQPQVSSVAVMPDMDGTMIHGMDTVDKTMYEGTIAYDICFRAIIPGSGERVTLIIIVEAQNEYYPGYPLMKRAVYYTCRAISSQYGREFTNSHYEKLKKVYSIWICTDPPKSRENTITRYCLTEENLVGHAVEPVENYDLVSIIMLCLGRPEGENYDGILRMLEVLLLNKADESEKRKILQNDYNIQMTQSLERKVSEMCNLSKGVLERGVAQGLEKGIAQGVEEGEARMLLSSLKRLIKNVGFSPEQAMSALEVPEEERQKYRDLLEQR